MFDLLECIGDPVGLVNLNQVVLKINHGGIMVKSKLFNHLCQKPDSTRLGFHPQVVVPGIMPATLIESGNLIS